MSDPAAPKGPARYASEVQSDLDFVLARLRGAGLTDAELAEAAADWEHTTDEERQALRVSPSKVLRSLVRETREWNDYHLTDEAESASRAAASALVAARTEAYERMSLSVRALLAWVGDDEYRAQAVLEYEQGPEGTRRTTLIGPLRELANAG